MKIVLLIAVILATALLLYIAFREKRHQKFAFTVALAVPFLALLAYLFFWPSAPAPIPDAELKQTFLENRQRAEENLKAVVEKNPKDTKTVMDLAHTMMEQTEYDDAVKTLDEGLQHNPDHPDLLQQRAIALFSKGLFLAEQKKYDEALASLKEAKAKAPKDAPYAANLDMFIKGLEEKINPSKKEKP